MSKQTPVLSLTPVPQQMISIKVVVVAIATILDLDRG